MVAGIGLLSRRGIRPTAGSSPATGALLWKGKPMGDGSRLESGRAMRLEGSTPSPSALCALGRSAKAPAFQAGQAGSTPASTPPPRTPSRPCVSPGKSDAESSNGRMRRSERLHVCSIPASASSQTEVIRPDEEPVLKTGGGEAPLVGSSPTASASWGHGPTGRRHLRTVEIRVRFPVAPLDWHSPVVQRQRHLVHTQETMVRLHPGLL